MRRHAIIAMVCLAVTASGWADEVTAGRIPFRNVIVTGVSDCQLVFRTAAGSTSKRPLAEITSIRLDDYDEFTSAEQALLAGNINDALRTYVQASADTTEPWLKTLINIRRVDALNRDGRLGEALRLWKRVYDANKGSANALALMPTTPGPMGSNANTQAIEYLKSIRPEDGSSELGQAVSKLLMAVYEADGDTEAAAREASGTFTDAADDSDGPDSSAGGSVEDRLRAAKLMLNSPERASQVAQAIQNDLHEYDLDLLGEAIMVWAKATRMQADAAAEAGEDDEARRLLAEAGVHFMYVATFFPDSPQAAEALFEAGRVNEGIGNPRAAWSAYDAVRTLYPDSEMAGRAEAAITELDSSD